MKKSTIGIFVGIGISILAITFIPGLVKYLVPPIDTSSDPEPTEPVYHRVEAEKYEIVFPKYVNSAQTYGVLEWADGLLDSVPLLGAIQFSDEDCLLDGDEFYLEFKVYCDHFIIRSRSRRIWPLRN